MNDMNDVQYVGFWSRVLAALIDTVLLLMVIIPLLVVVYGLDYFTVPGVAADVPGLWYYLLTWIFPAVAVVVFWIYRSATPGKMMVNAKIVDAKTGGKPSSGQLIGRYLAYYLSTIPLLLGLIWVGFDSRKQGWHDKLAGTLVVKGR